MDRMPVRALNASVSCESMDQPDGQPVMDRLRALLCARSARDVKIPDHPSRRDLDYRW